MKRSAAFLFMLIFHAALFAQFEGEITGKVTDADTKESIPNAYITVLSDQMVVMREVSDEFGTYVLKPLAPGTYDLEVTAFGYDTIPFTGLVVTSKGMTYQDLELREGIMIGEVVIKPSLVDKNTPTVMESYKAEDFNHRAVDGPIDVAKQAPTVLQNEQTGGLYVNGSREDATLYVVDGVKVIGSLYLPMKAIEEINVITGGIPANYGDVTGGIVEIITKNYSGSF